MFAHLARDMGSNDVTIFQFDPEHGIGQGLDDRTFHFYVFFFSHMPCFCLLSRILYRRSGIILELSVTCPQDFQDAHHRLIPGPC